MNRFINQSPNLRASQYKGIGIKPLPKLVPLEDLKYVNVLKKKVENYVVETIQRIIFGDPEEIFEMLGIHSDCYVGERLYREVPF